MNAVNQIEMAGTAMAVAQARKFPFLITLCARQLNGPVAEFTIDHAESFAVAGEKMYDRFRSVNAYVDKEFAIPNLDGRIVELCKLCDTMFGYCIFSIVVKRRDGE